VSGGQPIEELTRRAFSLWNDRDLEGLLEMFEPEAVWEGASRSAENGA